MVLQLIFLASFKSFVFFGLYIESKTTVFFLIIFFNSSFLIGVLLTYGCIPIEVAFIMMSILLNLFSWAKLPELHFNSLHNFLALLTVLFRIIKFPFFCVTP